MIFKSIFTFSLMLLSVGSYATPPASGKTELSQASDTDTEQLKNFSFVGKTAFSTHNEDFSDLINTETLPRELREYLGNSIVSTIDLLQLEALESAYRQDFSDNAVLAKTFAVPAMTGQEYQCALSKEERSFAPLGLALAYLTYERPFLEILPLLRESLQNILNYYTDNQPFIFNMVNESLPPLEDSTMPTINTEERIDSIKKCAKINYQILLKTPLTETLGFSSVAEAAGHFACLEFGPSYSQQELPLFRTPMERRFEQLIEQAQTLKDQIEYGVLINERAHSVDEKYGLFFVDELSHYINSCLRHSYSVNKGRSRSYNMGIEAAKNAKKTAYTLISRLAVTLYPNKAHAELAMIVKQMTEHDILLKGLATLFTENEEPNHENWIWPELVAGYKRPAQENSPAEASGSE